jgi:hypothetical protein
VDASIHTEGGRLKHSPHDDKVNDVALHMYTMLIPWSRVDANLRSVGGGGETDLKLPKIQETKDWPVLSIESTELTIGNWEWKENRTTRELIREIPSLNHGAVYRKLWKKIKMHTSGDNLMKDDFYRLDLCGYSVQLFRRFGIHTVLFLQRHSPNDWKYGVPKMDFMKGGPNIGMKVIGRVSASDRPLLKYLEQRMPILFPISYTPSSPLPPVKSPHKENALMFMRTIDWDTQTDHNLLAECLQRHGRFRIVSQQTLTIMDQMSVYMYEIGLTN